MINSLKNKGTNLGKLRESKDEVEEISVFSMPRYSDLPARSDMPSECIEYQHLK